MLGRADLGSQTSPTLTGKDFSSKAIVYLVYTVLCSLCVKLFDQLLAVFALLDESLANIAPYSFQEKMYIGVILINFLAWASNLLDTSWSKIFFPLSLISSIFSIPASRSATCLWRTTCWSRSETVVQLTIYIDLLIAIHMCTSITLAVYIKHAIKCNII